MFAGGGGQLRHSQHPPGYLAGMLPCCLGPLVQDPAVEGGGGGFDAEGHPLTQLRQPMENLLALLG
ncbi:hypothetical protein D3C76_1708610 [compost metagenome]